MGRISTLALPSKYTQGLLVENKHLSLTSAQAAPRPTELIATWSKLNSQCRGGSGDDPSTMHACEQRDAVGRRIDRAGWCFGKTGQSG